MVQALVPVPVLVVFAIEPVQELLCVPTDAALPRLVVTELISVATLAKMLIMVPAVGADLVVIVVLV